mmetsp:Transcript_24995/g.42820  ORF Transcript_24995/g.42820 Transcript_24995/m.42820 type:complete len:81 (+) Transcript_24995:895-1137(+)
MEPSSVATSAEKWRDGNVNEVDGEIMGNEDDPRDAPLVTRASMAELDAADGAMHRPACFEAIPVATRRVRRFERIIVYLR